MKKTEMMKRYEAETGESARDELYSGSIKLYMPANDYIAWLEAKAAAYYKLMSGGKKTLKEWANFLGMNVAVEDEEIYGRRVFASPIKMFLKFDTTIYGPYKFWALSERGDFFHLPPDLIDYTGDWEDSLTFPDGWRKI